MGHGQHSYPTMDGYIMIKIMMMNCLCDGRRLKYHASYKVIIKVAIVIQIWPLDVELSLDKIWCKHHLNTPI